jgi:hypothetical protein
MVPPLRYRKHAVKALLVPDLGPIRPPNPRHFAAALGLHG